MPPDPCDVLFITGSEANPVALRTNGVQLTILALKAALENMTELSNEDWQHLDISGLHSRHYVETGGRLLSHDHDKESIKGERESCLLVLNVVSSTLEVVEDARGLKWTHMISRHYTISLQRSIRMVCSMVCTISFCIGVGRKCGNNGNDL